MPESPAQEYPHTVRGQLMKISVDELIPGMFVGDVFNDRGVLLYSAEALITDESQILKLKNHGVRTVYIYPEKGCSVHTAPAPAEEAPVEELKVARDYLSQLNRARKIYSGAVSVSQQVTDSIAKAKPFDPRIIQYADRFVDEVLQSPDVFLAVCRMKNSDERLYTHSVNVAVLTASAAQYLKFSQQDITQCVIGALLHDLGMVKIPRELREKERGITAAEYALVKKHPLLGLEMLDSIGKFPEQSKKVVAQHHERFNGGGYPHRLKGEQVLECSYICAIADVYDTLVTATPSRRSCLPQEALALIFQGAGEEYPKELVEVFTRFLGIYPVGSFVKLESGEMGLVIKNNRHSLLTPSVIICHDKRGNRLRKPFLRDLSAPRFESTPMPWRLEQSLNPNSYGIEMDMIQDWLSGKACAAETTTI